MTLATAVLALAESRHDLIRRSGLLAVGAGMKVVGGRSTGEPCVKTFDVRKVPRARLSPGEAVPEVLEARAGPVRADVEEMMPLTGPPWSWQPASGGDRPWWPNG